MMLAVETDNDDCEYVDDQHAPSDAGHYSYPEFSF